MSLGKKNMNLEDRAEAASRVIVTIFDSFGLGDAGVDVLADLLLMRVKTAGTGADEIDEFLGMLKERFMLFSRFSDK